MFYYLLIIVFVLSIAMTSASIVITSHLKSAYKTETFSSLLFFLVFYFTFGFYAIWGQLLMETIVSQHVSEQLLQKMRDVLLLLGSPFLIMASLMFIKFSREVSARKTSNSFIFWYLLINLVIIFGLGFIIFNTEIVDSQILMKYYFVIICLLSTCIGVYFLLVPGREQSKFRNSDIVRLSLIILVLIILQNLLQLIPAEGLYLSLVFIFVFFISGSISPLYLKYICDLSGLIPEEETSQSFEHFCHHFTISPRETEIIHEICKGHSNQEIADRLFISLQTVKDHTHRIYSKTDCASRAQLIRKVNETEL